MTIGLRRSIPSPVAFLNGGVVLPWVAVWVALSCSVWFGLPDIEGLPQLTAARIVFTGIVAYAGITAALHRSPIGSMVASELALWTLVVVATLSGLVFGGFASGYAGSSVSILFNFVLFPAVAYSILLRTQWSAHDLARLCLILTLFGAYLGCTAILERTPLATLLIPPTIADPTIVQHWGRSRGPFLQAEFNGAVMTMLLPVAVVLLAFPQRLPRLVAWSTIPLLCVGVYLTETRAALLSLGLIALLGVSRRHPGRRVYGALCIGMCLAALALGARGDVVLPRMDEPSPLPDRLNLLLSTATMIAAHPLLGVGFGNFDLYQEEFFLHPQVLGGLSTTTRSEFWAGGTHNTLLTPAAELGVVAGVLYLALVVWGVVSAGARSTALTEASPGEASLPTCAFLVGVAFMVNAVFVELRFTLTPNALLWAFIGLVQRQRMTTFLSTQTGPDGPRLQRMFAGPTHVARDTSPT